MARSNKNQHSLSNTIGPVLERLEIRNERDYLRQQVSTIKNKLRRLLAQSIGGIHQAEASNTADLKKDIDEVRKDITKAIKALEK